MSSHTAQTELKFIGKLILEGDLHCETGLHIGAGKGTLEIGGADNPVVKDAFGRPYIPGQFAPGTSPGSCWNNRAAWRFPANSSICRDARVRKSASIRVTVRTTKSASCSVEIPVVWNVCKASHSIQASRRHRV